jgi:hypothetical protein
MALVEPGVPGEPGEQPVPRADRITRWCVAEYLMEGLRQEPTVTKLCLQETPRPSTQETSCAASPRARRFDGASALPPPQRRACRAGHSDGAAGTGQHPYPSNE